MADSSSDVSGTERERNRAERHAAPPSDPVVELRDVAKRFGSETAVDEFTLSVREGELLSLVGPSGCGKTTTLRLIAGLERPSEGTIRIDGAPVADTETFVEPYDRDVGVVFQEFALFPFLTAAENVAFGVNDLAEQQRERRVRELLELVGLSEHADENPAELSGGQQQRIALARALAPEPALLLLDEPFSNLDEGLRQEMREEVGRILTRTGTTAISVTHDQEEALSFGDRVAVMNDGGLEQVGRPAAVFQRPRTRFVATFLGDATCLSGRFVDARVESALGTLPEDRLYGLPPGRPDDLEIVLRPNDVTITSAPSRTADGTVVHSQYTGSSIKYRVELESGESIHCLTDYTDQYDVGAPVDVTINPDLTVPCFEP